MLQALGQQEAVGGDAQGGMMMKAPPAASFVVPQTQVLLEILVVTLDAPAHLDFKHHAPQRHVLRQRGQPVLQRLGISLGPLDEQPLGRSHFVALAVAGWMAFNVGLFHDAILYNAQSIVLWRALGDKANLALSLRRLSVAMFQPGIAEGLRDMLEECVALCRQVGDPLGLGLALSFLGFAVGLVDREFDHARELLHESIATLRPLDDPHPLGQPIMYLGLLAIDTGDYASARMHLEENLRLVRQGDIPYTIAVGSMFLAETVQLQADYVYARELYLEGLALSRAVGARRVAAENLLGLGQVAYATGAVEPAISSFVESLALHRELDFRFGVAKCLLAFARVLLDRHKSESAARLYGAADALLEAGFLFPFPRFDRERTLELLRNQMDASVLDAGIRAGRGLTMAQAADFALECINA